MAELVSGLLLCITNARNIVKCMQILQPQDIETPIERQPLHQLVASRVRDMIIEGRLAPGDQVNESRLCEELGVSRTPMREAIRTLSSEGLIVLRPGRSTIVRAFTPEEVKDMLDVIAELEALAGRRACLRHARPPPTSPRLPP